jgi:hypothetical protein
MGEKERLEMSFCFFGWPRVSILAGAMGVRNGWTCSYKGGKYFGGLHQVFKVEMLLRLCFSTMEVYVIASHVNLQNSEFVWLVISLYLISQNNALRNVLSFLFLSCFYRLFLLIYMKLEGFIIIVIVPV